MAAELITGLGALKTAFDLAKGLKDINDAAIRNAAVIELQERIIAAQQAQSALIESVGNLEKEVACLKDWEAEKQRYQLADVGDGVVAYRLKPGVESTEAPHLLCAHCYQQGKKSFLQATQELKLRRRVHLCPACKTNYAFNYVPRPPTPEVIRLNPGGWT